MLGRFWDPKSDPEIDQKSVLGAPGRPRDAEGCPEASREPFWSRLGPILERFWEPCWGDLGAIFEYISNPAALPLLLPQRPSFPVSQGRRVPALALTILETYVSAIQNRNSSNNICILFPNRSRLVKQIQEIQRNSCQRELHGVPIRRLLLLVPVVYYNKNE